MRTSKGIIASCLEKGFYTLFLNSQGRTTGLTKLFLNTWTLQPTTFWPAGCMQRLKSPLFKISTDLLIQHATIHWKKNGLPLSARIQACKSSSAQKQPCNCVWLPRMPTKSSQCFYLLLLQHPSTSVDATTIPSSHLLFDWQN